MRFQNGFKAKGATNGIGTGQYVFMWQFLENDSLWKDLSANVAAKLDALPINGSDNYSHGQYSYTVSKQSVDEVIQTNDSTQNQRDLRRILFDRKSGQRVVWQYFNEHSQWVPVDTDLMLKLMSLPISQSMKYKRGKWRYTITKQDASTCTQLNLKTNTKRQYRLQMMNHDAMDNGWTSKGILCVFAVSEHLQFQIEITVI